MASFSRRFRIGPHEKELILVLDETGGDYWVRMPIVPGLNDGAEDLAKSAAFVGGLKNARELCLLPYHRAGMHKFDRLGMRHELEQIKEPSAERMEEMLSGQYEGGGDPFSDLLWGSDSLGLPIIGRREIWMTVRTEGWRLAIGGPDSKASSSDDAFDPLQNLRAGAEHLRGLLDEFDGNLTLALAAYNAGENAVKEYGNQVPPYKETRNYVRKVINYYREYRKTMPL